MFTTIENASESLDDDVVWNIIEENIDSLFYAESGGSSDRAGICIFFAVQGVWMELKRTFVTLHFL